MSARLGLEITESTALHDVALAREWIEQLSGMGCQFALDDFGTGFNSLTQLLQLPVHHIKIDGSFIRGAATDRDQWAIVAAVKVLADGLGMETVAECIETPEVLDKLRALGVTYGQGYLLGRPAPQIAGGRRAAAA